MKIEWIFCVVILLVIIISFGVIKIKQKNISNVGSLFDNIENDNQTLNNNQGVAARLQTYLEQQRDYLFYVGMPLDVPMQWQQVEAVDSQLVLDGQQLVLDEVQSFIVAYADKQLLDMFNPFYPIPSDLKSVNPKPSSAQNIILLSDLEHGKNYVTIEIGKSIGHKNDPEYYSTAIKNISDVKIKVKEFGGFDKVGLGLNTKLKCSYCYNADEFISWFGVNVDGWIKPGETVADFDNYGESYWVYFCETENGESFIAGLKTPSPNSRNK